MISLVGRLRCLGLGHRSAPIRKGRECAGGAPSLPGRRAGRAWNGQAAESAPGWRDAGPDYGEAMLDSNESNAAVWKSDEHVAKWVASTDERERGRVAARRLLAEFLPFGQDEAFTFVDLGAGTGAATRAVLDRFPAATAVLADYSPQMMEEGRRALAPYEGRYRYVEVELAAGRWPAELQEGLQAVISSLCVHHLPDDRKAGLFGEILARLAPGAWYLNYDPVRGADPAVEEAWTRVVDRRDPEAAAGRAQRSPDEQARWENHVRHIVGLDTQLALLRSAGYEAVDVYWKELDHAITGGRRPLS